jgi:hypothetical protein
MKPRRFRLRFWLGLAIAAIVLGVTGSASGGPTKLQFERCDGLVKGAPWTEAFRGKIGPERGSRYAVWISSLGPSCASAKSHAARLSRLHTARALRRASFGGLMCRISPLRSVSARLLSVRPRSALGGCWTRVDVAVPPYFYWQPRR